MAGDLARIERNVRKMIDMQAPEAEIDSYLSTEGYTPQRFRETMLVKKPPKDKRPFADTSWGKTYYGFSDTLDRGLSANFSDEIKALGGGVGSMLKGEGFGKGYDDALAQQRASVKQFQTDNPVLGTATEIAGGFLAAGPAAAGQRTLAQMLTGRTLAPTPQLATPIQSTLQATARGAGAGATFGAVSGFGAEEGGLGERAMGALKGGVLGGAIGGGIPLIAAAARPVVGKVASALGLRDADQAARQQILRAFERDGITPEDAIRRLNDWQMQGAKPEMLIDLGGENVRGLARAAAGVPGEAKNTAVRALETRQQGQFDRVSDDIAGTLSPVDPTRFFGSIDDISRQRAGAAQPLYERAFSAAPVHNDRVASFLQDPIIQQGVRRGMEIQRLEALAAGRPFNPRDYAITGFNDAGDPIISGVPNMRLLDAAKRGLDDVLEGYRDSTTGRLRLDERGRAIDAVRRSYVETLDGLNPDYRAARQAWSGPSQSIDAMNAGRSLLTKDPELSAQQIARLSEGDRDFFRAGVVKALRDKMAAAPDGADEVKRIFGNRAIRERLREAFPDANSFMRFEAAMRREADMYRNAQAVNPRSGSQTALRQQEVGDMGNDPIVGTLVDSIAGGQTLWNSAMNVARSGAAHMRGQGMNPDTASALSPLMFNPDTAANVGLLGQLAQQRDAAIAQLMHRQGRAGLLGVGGGNAAGGLLGP